jgi:RecA-family ATPase
MIWTPISVTECIATPPPPLDYVIPGLVAGTVGSIVAPGATGKSWLALQIGSAVAGADTLSLAPRHTGRVLYLAAEDPAPVLHARLHTLGAVLSVQQRDALADNLVVMPLLGRVGDLLDDGQTAAQLIEHARNCRLIVLDTLSRWHTGDENARSDAARVMRALERICDLTQSTALFLHHTNKAAVLDGHAALQQASRGSSVFVDDARFVMTMTTCTDQEARDYGIDEAMRNYYVKLTYAKCNYLPPQPARWYRRREGGRLEPTDMLIAKAKKQPVRQPTTEGDDDDWR